MALSNETQLDEETRKIYLTILGDSRVKQAMARLKKLGFNPKLVAEDKVHFYLLINLSDLPKVIESQVNMPGVKAMLADDVLVIEMRLR